MKNLLTTACLRVVTIVAIVTFTASPAELLAQTRPTAQSQPLVFTQVTVIDVTERDSKRALKLNQTVIVTGERITALGRTGKVPIPQGAQVIDATGRFLIPGLWDMHVHLRNDRNIGAALNLLLANGVTGMRHMGGNLEFVIAMRQQLASGSLFGPRMVVTGPALDGPRGPNDRNPKELGTIERGKLADLVLLDANPLDDINNTRRINGVIVNGRYLPKVALQTMLAEARVTHPSAPSPIAGAPITTRRRSFADAQDDTSGKLRGIIGSLSARRTLTPHLRAVGTACHPERQRRISSTSTS